MNCSTAFSMKMESKKMATKALEIMKSVLAQTDVDGFKYQNDAAPSMNITTSASEWRMVASL